MDFILKKINQKINIFTTQNKTTDLNVYTQVRIEYLLFLSLGYLWNKNINKIDDLKKEKIFNEILNPTIGSIVGIIRILDIDKEILSKDVSKMFNDYPEYRNKLIGHGYTFSDSKEQVYDVLDNLYLKIKNTASPIIKNDWSYYVVTSIDEIFYSGIRYDNNNNEEPFKILKSSLQLENNNIYISADENINTPILHRISPFIHIKPEDSSVFCFSKVSEKLTGKINYNQIFKTKKWDFEWQEFEALYIQNDGKKIKCQNGTIRNQYNNNFKKYIDIGIKSKLINFLKNGKSSVAAILWGHGGVGKTATIQSVCDDFSNQERKTFDYIIFLSAKDRLYNMYSGEISEIKDRIASYHDLMMVINDLVFDNQFTSISEIEDSFINFQHTILLVIDDYESFSKDDKSKINELIPKLNINHHKVVITTRSANIKIGEEFQTNELDENNTFSFLKQILINENLMENRVIDNELNTKNNIKKIHFTTSGRPIFIMQLAYIMAAKGINLALTSDIKSDENAVNFLFGRVFDYLSSNGKKLFVVISLLVTQDDLSNILAKAQFILNMEFPAQASEFRQAVDELIKLKIIKLDEEERIFEVYSQEIYQKMSDYFYEFENTLREEWIERNDQINNSSTNIEQALLETANASRLSKPELEVIDAYHRVLNRITGPIEIKFQAISMLAQHLASLRKKDEALRQISNYKHLFNDINNLDINISYAKLYAQYSWANGKTEDRVLAAKILNDFLLNVLSNKMLFSQSLHDNNELLELNGLLMQYSCVNLIDAFDDLKEERERKEIYEQEYNDKRNELKNECSRLIKQFEPIWNGINKGRINLNILKNSTKQNLITGIYNYIDVLIRNGKTMQLANDISVFMRDNTPPSFYAQFDRKANYTQKKIEERNYRKYKKWH